MTLVVSSRVSEWASVHTYMCVCVCVYAHTHTHFSQIFHSEMEVFEVEQYFYVKVAVPQM
jgi:hypothetical protein